MCWRNKGCNTEYPKHSIIQRIGKSSTSFQGNLVMLWDPSCTVGRDFLKGPMLLVLSFLMAPRHRDNISGTPLLLLLRELKLDMFLVLQVGTYAWF